MRSTDSPRVFSREQQALRYANAGWPVFPLIPGEKVPATRNGFLDASTNPGLVHYWWARNPERNIGIATGSPGPDVLDVDVYPDGSGFPAFNELKRAGLLGGAYAYVRTPSGGLHAYAEGSDQRNGHLPRHHIDFRSAGGYVVAPGSHVAGKPYRVMQRQTPQAKGIDWQAVTHHLEPEPPQLSAAQAAARERQRERAREDPASDVERLSAWVARQPEGNRNHGLFYAANRLLELGADPDELRDAARTVGLDDREIGRTIDSARRVDRPKVREPEREAAS
jgi:bifunctional DNA primase/polymerase-like protein